MTSERDLEMARDLERVMALPLRALVEKWKGHAVFSKVTNSTRSDIVSPFYVKVQDVTALLARAREEQRERCAEIMRREWHCCDKPDCLYEAHGERMAHILLGEGDEEEGQRIAAAIRGQA